MHSKSIKRGLAKSKKDLLLKQLASAVLVVFYSIFPVKVFAETFRLNGDAALNTNNKFRRIDGYPRLSLYKYREDDNDQQLERLRHNLGGNLLKHRSTGNCLNTRDLTNGSELNVRPCNPDDPNQNFILTVDSQGFTQIKRGGTDKCIDAPTRDNEGKVYLWDCQPGNPNQQWKSSATNDNNPPKDNSSYKPLETPQEAQYFRDRPQFYMQQGNSFAATGYGSSVLGHNSSGKEGNCTWYTYGRLLELGFTPEDILSPPGQRNANQWGRDLKNGARILGPNETPQLGDVAQYYLNGRNHVAIVEKFENGRVFLSESHYSTDFDGDKDDDGITKGDGTLHRIVNYAVGNPNRYIRLVRH